MKKAILAGMIFLFAITLQGFAQDKQAKERKTPEERARKQTELMTQQLGLTEAQVARISVINLEAAKKMEAARQKKAEQKKAKMEEMKAIRTDRENSYKAIMQPEQFAKYLEAKEKAKEKSKQRRHAKKPVRK